MTRKLTNFTFYQNTPFTDFQNYIDFGSNEARDNFFATHYNPVVKAINYNFVRDRLTLNISANDANWAWLQECNYCSFINPFDNIMYYCQVVQAEYINNGVIRLSLVYDGLMTFCQGDLSPYAKNVMIQRQHLTKSTFNNNLDAIRRDGDVLQFSSEKYFTQENYAMTELRVIFRSSADLTADFGNKDDNDPKIKTSTGVTFDKIVSPQNLYMTPYDQYNNFMKEIADYPWIAQNITSLILVPKKMLDDSNFKQVSMKNSNFNYLYEFKTGGKSSNLGQIESISKNWDSLTGIFSMENHPELLRKGYCDINLTNYQGQKLDIDLGLLDKDGLDIRADLIIGYSNQLYFYINGYKARDEDYYPNLPAGSYIEDSIAYSKFDSAPMLLDQYKLEYAKQSHQRALDQNNLISGQVGNVFNNNAPIQDRFFSAVSLTSDASLGAITGKMTDEWQYYRKLNAELADKKLTPPSISEMSTENAFPVKQGFFGIVVRYSKINDTDIKIAKNYYAHFGHQWTATGNLESTESMKYLNYAKFSGNWIINDKHVPQSIMEQIRAQFENGVKIWHNPDNLENPFKQDISELNTWV